MLLKQGDKTEKNDKKQIHPKSSSIISKYSHDKSNNAPKIKSNYSSSKINSLLYQSPLNGYTN